MNNGKILKHLITAQGKVFQRAVQIGVRKLSVNSALRKNHYDVLGVKRDATQAEIKNAYFELSKIYHPDRIEGTDENISKFREITTAYEVLGNEQSRKFYDRGLLTEKTTAYQAEVVEDPIVKFYKDRQEFSRKTLQKEDTASWVPPPQIKPLRRTKGNQSELFSESKQIDVRERRGFPFLYLMACTSVAMYILVMSHVKNSTLEKFWRNF